MKTENLKLIQRYFDKELQGEELIQFKKKMEEDGAFAKDVQQFAATIIGIRVAEKLKKQNKTITFKRYWKPLAIAASIALIICVGYLLLHKEKQTEIHNITEHDSIINKDTITRKQIENKISPNQRKDNYIADNYNNLKLKIVKTTGAIVLKKTQKPLATGDEILSEAIIEFKTSNAKAALINMRTKSLMILTADNIPDNSSQVLKSHLSPLAVNNVRAGSFDHISDVDGYFGNYFVVLTKAFITINAQKYPMGEGHIFFIRYKYQGEEINKKLEFNDDTLFIDKEKLYQVDNKPIAKPDNNHVKLYYMNGENKSILISEFNLVFPDSNSLKKEISVFWPELNTESFDKKVDEVIVYINEFYGKPNKDNVANWLRENFK